MSNQNGKNDIFVEEAYVSEGEEIGESYKSHDSLEASKTVLEPEDRFDYGDDAQSDQLLSPPSSPLQDNQDIVSPAQPLNTLSPTLSSHYSQDSQPSAPPVSTLEGLDEDALREKYRQLQAALENDDLEEGAEPTFEGFDAQDIPPSPEQSGDEMELELEEQGVVKESTFAPYSPLQNSQSNQELEEGVRVGGRDDHVTDIFGASDDDDDKLGGEPGSFEGFNESDIEESEQALANRRKAVRRKDGGGGDDSDENEIFGVPDALEEQGGISAKRKRYDSGDEGNNYNREEDAILPTLTDDEDDDDQLGAADGFGREKKRQDGDDDDGMSDFDRMMALKRAERRAATRRRRRDVDFINDSDDKINCLINRMKAAWEEDRLRNSRKEPAFKKLQLLPVVMAHLKKVDLQSTFLDSGVLSAFSDWLQPLPDRSLPHLQIREEILKILLELPPVDVAALKSSFIGKSVMYLYKHPKETKENRRRAGKLINEWSRSIFNIPTDYKALSREEREERDILLNRAKKMTQKLVPESGTRPGEKGFIGRARVPQPSTQDYVVRPKPKISLAEFNQRRTNSGKGNRLDKLRKIMLTRKPGKRGKANAQISLEGRKLSL